MNNNTYKSINTQFIHAFQNNDTLKVKNLLIGNVDNCVNIHIVDEKGFNALYWACGFGNEELVDFLLTSPLLKEHINIHFNDDYILYRACEKNKLEIVKYLLTSPKLTEHVDITADLSHGFSIACDRGFFDIVKFMISSPSLKVKLDIDTLDNLALLSACIYAHLDFIVYLLTSPELEKHAQLHKNNDQAFQSLCSGSALPQYMKVIEYLIFDYRIILTSDIEDGLPLYPHVQKMFSNRKLHEQLENNLVDKNAINTKIKI